MSSVYHLILFVCVCVRIFRSGRDSSAAQGGRPPSDLRRWCGPRHTEYARKGGRRLIIALVWTAPHRICSRFIHHEYLSNCSGHDFVGGGRMLSLVRSCLCVLVYFWFIFFPQLPLCRMTLTSLFVKSILLCFCLHFFFLCAWWTKACFVCTCVWYVLCWVNFLPSPLSLFPSYSRRGSFYRTFQDSEKKSFGSSEGKRSYQCFVGLRRFYFHILRHRITSPVVLTRRRSVSCYCLGTREAYLFHRLRLPEKNNKEKLSEIENLFVATGKKNRRRSQKVTFLSPYLHMHVCFVCFVSLSLFARCSALHCCRLLLDFLLYPILSLLAYRRMLCVFCKKNWVSRLLVWWTVARTTANRFVICFPLVDPQQTRVKNECRGGLICRILRNMPSLPLSFSLSSTRKKMLPLARLLRLLAIACMSLFSLARIKKTSESLARLTRIYHVWSRRVELWWIPSLSWRLAACWNDCRHSFAA